METKGTFPISKGTISFILPFRCHINEVRQLLGELRLHRVVGAAQTLQRLRLHQIASEAALRRILVAPRSKMDLI